MKYFKITYSCGCGENEEYIEACDIVEASDIAYNEAIEEYTRYEGYHGVRSFADIAEEDFGVDLSEEIEDEALLAEIEEVYAMEREETIYYNAIEISYEEYINRGIKEMRYFKVSEAKLRGVCCIKTENEGWIIDTEIPIFTQDREYIEKRFNEGE
jgi:hypothetical protein